MGMGHVGWKAVMMVMGLYKVVAAVGRLAVAMVVGVHFLHLLR